MRAPPLFSRRSDAAPCARPGGPSLALALTLALALPACGDGAKAPHTRATKTQQALPSPACETQALHDLAAQLETLDPHARPAAARETLLRICELPTFVEQSLALADGSASFSPRSLVEAMGPAFELACPDSGRVLQAMVHSPVEGRGKVLYEGCKFERFEVLSLDDFAWSPAPPQMPWAFHRWLLDEGVPPEDARPITRALLDFEFAHTVGRGISSELIPPHVDAVLPPLVIGERVELGREGLRLGAHDFGPLAADDDAENDPLVALSTTLAELAAARASQQTPGRPEWTPPMIVAVDGRVEYGTLRRLDEVIDAWAGERMWMVERGTFRPAALFDARIVGQDAAEPAAEIRVRITRSGDAAPSHRAELRGLGRDGISGALADDGRLDETFAAQLAEALAAREAGAVTLVVEAPDALAWKALAPLLAALHRAGCGAAEYRLSETCGPRSLTLRAAQP